MVKVISNSESRSSKFVSSDRVNIVFYLAVFAVRRIIEQNPTSLKLVSFATLEWLVSAHGVKNFYTNSIDHHERDRRMGVCISGQQAP